MTASRPKIDEWRRLEVPRDQGLAGSIGNPHLQSPDIRHQLLLGIEIDQLAWHARVAIGDGAFEDRAFATLPALFQAEVMAQPSNRKDASPCGLNQPLGSAPCSSW